MKRRNLQRAAYLVLLAVCGLPLFSGCAMMSVGQAMWNMMRGGGAGWGMMGW